MPVPTRGAIRPPRCTINIGMRPQPSRIRGMRSLFVQFQLPMSELTDDGRVSDIPVSCQTTTGSLAEEGGGVASG